MFISYVISWLLPYQLVLNSIIYFRFRQDRCDEYIGIWLCYLTCELMFLYFYEPR